MTAADVFLAKWADIAALGSAASVLSWDQETKMPPKGQASRGHALSVLAGLHHDHLTDPALSEAIAAAADDAQGDPTLAAQVDAARRDVVRATAIPGDLARRMAEVQSRALGSWQQAKADADFASFVPVLSEVIALTLEQADALVDAGIGETRYDALLDAYEPGATEAQFAELLGDLRAELSPLVKAVADSGITVDESPALGDFSDRSPAVARTHRRRGHRLRLRRRTDRRVGASVHHQFRDPATSASRGDPSPTTSAPGCSGSCTRPATRCMSRVCRAPFARTPLGEAASLGIHESQSRLWENQVGRSRPFWQWALPHFHERIPRVVRGHGRFAVPGAPHDHDRR